MLQRAPGRVVAAVSAQPSGVDPKNPKHFYNSNMKNWGPTLVASRPELNMDMVQKFLDRMYGNVDFVLTATRDYVRNCHTPLLVLPDNHRRAPLRNGDGNGAYRAKFTGQPVSVEGYETERGAGRAAYPHVFKGESAFVIVVRSGLAG